MFKTIKNWLSIQKPLEIKAYIVGENDFFKSEKIGYTRTVKFKKSKKSGKFRLIVLVVNNQNNKDFILVMGKSELSRYKKDDNMDYETFALKTAIKKLNDNIHLMNK